MYTNRIKMTPFPSNMLYLKKVLQPMFKNGHGSYISIINLHELTLRIFLHGKSRTADVLTIFWSSTKISEEKKSLEYRKD